MAGLRRFFDGVQGAQGVQGVEEVEEPPTWSDGIWERDMDILSPTTYIG